MNNNKNKTWSGLWPERVSSNRQSEMEELIQGRDEVASGQLSRVIHLHNNRSLVVNGDHNHDLGSADGEGFVNKMLGSFSNTPFISNGKEMEGFHHDDDQDQLISAQIIQVNTSGGGGAGASSWDVDHLLDHAIKGEASHEESCRSASTYKDRGGSYKRRKTCHSWIRDSPALTEDGHAWRKYGQKTILNAKHPRNYFRCTHKFDQACQATKHVQQVEDDPPLFRTTYYGNHTCRDYLKASELVLDCASPRESSKFIKFDDTNHTSKQEHPFFSSFKSLKREEHFKEETTPSDYMTTQQHHNQLALGDYLVSPPDLSAFKSPAPMSGFASVNIAQLDEDAIYRKMADDFAYDEFLQYELW